MSKHIMIDIETLGTSSNCVVASIGAKEMFGKGEFYRKLDWSQQTRKRRVIEPSTVRWWLQQSADAQAELVEVGDDVETVLNDLADFCGRDSHCFLWANGSIFDIGILRSLYHDFRVGFPTTYDKELDFRTVRRVVEIVKPNHVMAWLDNETAHDALGDAKSQAHALENIFSEVFGYKQEELKPIKKPKKKAAKKKVEEEPTPAEEPEAEEKPKPKRTRKKKAEPKEKTYTVDDVREALRGYSADTTKEKAVALMTKITGVTKVSEIAEDKYGELMEAINGG